MSSIFGDSDEITFGNSKPLPSKKPVFLKEKISSSYTSEDKPEVHITNKDNLCSSQDVTNDISKRDTHANSFRTKLAKKENPCLLPHDFVK